MKRLHAFALIAVALAFGAFTGAAVAGGNGNGNGGSAPGNSANAPGQQTQEGQPAQPATQQPAPAQSAPATSSHGVNATSVGMKPGPTTKKDVHTTVGASPDVSKRYGNGKTAAQIAKGRGAPANTDIYGPGNSQPHKVCGKNGHYVDVHAVKSYSGLTCTQTHQVQHAQQTKQTQQTQQTSAANAANTSNTSHVSNTSNTSNAAAATNTVHTSNAANASNAAGTQPPAGGVLGAQKTVTAPKTARAGHGVLGTARAAKGTLPFTGFPIWAAVLAAAALGAAGVLVRRWAVGTSRS